MKFTLRLTLFFAAVLAAPVTLAGGPIDIGGVQAALGDPKQGVIEAISAKYDINELRTNTYVVYDGDPSENTIGVLQFEDDQLVWASRDVGAFEGEAVQTFSRTLFELLASLNPDDREPIRLTTSVSTSQPIAFGSITLEFKDRSVVIDIGFDAGLVDASIEEIIFTSDSTAAPGARKQGVSTDHGAAVASLP